jgi:hypothetical protein
MREVVPDLTIMRLRSTFLAPGWQRTGIDSQRQLTEHWTTAPDRRGSTGWFRMASIVLKVLLAASLLTHTVLGCCWHHAHGGECPDGVVAAGVAEPHCDAEEHAHHAPHHPATADAGEGLCTLGCESHEHPAACDEPDCSYVRSSPLRFTFADMPTLTAVLASSADADCRSLTRRAVDSPPRVWSPGLHARSRPGWSSALSIAKDVGSGFAGSGDTEPLLLAERGTPNEWRPDGEWPRNLKARFRYARATAGVNVRFTVRLD